MGYSKGQKTLRSYDQCAPPPKKTKAEPLEPINEIENDNLNVVQILKSHDEVVALEKPKIDRDYFCVPCQIQTQNMSQHKRSKKHAGNVLALQTKFKVQDESITNKDYEALVAEKGWLSDSVSLVIQFKIIFILFYYLRL
jgi:hypothetical protein